MYQIAGKEQKFILNLAHRRRSSLSCFGSHFVQQRCDMFLFLHEVQFTGYADRNAPFVVRRNIPDAISVLEEIGEKIWFSDNEMKLNTDKCRLLMNTKDKNLLKIVSFNTKKKFFWQITEYYHWLQIKDTYREKVP